MTVTERLFELGDKEYAAFSQKITPNIEIDSFIGVRVPQVRKLAKEIYREGSYEEFLGELPHTYFEENMLHGLIICEFRDYDRCVEALDAFLPYVDNWAVCDTMSPVCFKRNKGRLIVQIEKWIRDSYLYTSRFGMGMLMKHFLDEDFREEYLELPASVKSDEYYLNMMIAWFFATALAKQWDASVKYITEKRLDTWVHNKTIQKAVESYRITDEQKKFLKELRIKKEK